MFKKVLLILFIAIAGFTIFVATRPDDFRVSRSARITAPPAIIFAYVNDLRRWNLWSPWVKLDPAAKNSFSGAQEGVGAALTWSGNNQVGEGTMTITESRANDLIRTKLEFVKPFASTSDTEYTFRGEGDQTVVTWTMSGKNNFIAKAISCFMNCDKMIGGMFDEGLANLKALAESAPKI
jgi:hypothetical protein